MTCDEDCTDCPKISTFSSSFSSLVDTKNLELLNSNMELLTPDNGNNINNIFNSRFIFCTILVFSLFGFFEACKSIYYYCCNYNNKNKDKVNYTYHSI